MGYCLGKISDGITLVDCSVAFLGLLVRLLTKTKESRNLELTEYNVPNAQSRGLKRRAIIRSIIFSDSPFFVRVLELLLKHVAIF